jgi:hypothetical protein
VGSGNVSLNATATNASQANNNAYNNYNSYVLFPSDSFDLSPQQLEETAAITAAKLKLLSHRRRTCQFNTLDRDPLLIILLLFLDYLYLIILKKKFFVKKLFRILFFFDFYSIINTRVPVCIPSNPKN